MTLPFARTSLHQFLVKGFSFVLFELLDEGVFNLCEETTIELIPFGSFEITLLQDCSFSENVNIASYVEIPAINNLTLVLFVSRINFLNIVLSIFDYDLVRLSIKSIDDRYLVSFSVFNPPRLKS